MFLSLSDVQWNPFGHLLLWSSTWFSKLHSNCPWGLFDNFFCGNVNSFVFFGHSALFFWALLKIIRQVFEKCLLCVYRKNIKETTFFRRTNKTLPFMDKDWRFFVFRHKCFLTTAFFLVQKNIQTVSIFLKKFFCFIFFRRWAKHFWPFVKKHLAWSSRLHCTCP